MRGHPASARVLIKVDTRVGRSIHSGKIDRRLAIRLHHDHRQQDEHERCTMLHISQNSAKMTAVAHRCESVDGDFIPCPLLRKTRIRLDLPATELRPGQLRGTQLRWPYAAQPGRWIRRSQPRGTDWWARDAAIRRPLCGPGGPAVLLGEGQLAKFREELVEAI